MQDSVLIITEVFHPEEFLINDIAQRWMKEGKKVIVLTRNPAYPFGKIFNGYSNKFFSKQEENGITVYRYHIIENYRDSKFRKITNYLWNAFLASSVALLLLRKNKNIFIYHTGPLTVALPGVLLKKMNRGRIAIWTQDVWPDVAFAYGLKRNKITTWLIEKFVNFIYRNSNKIITTSRPVQADIAHRVSVTPEFIPNWPMNVFNQSASHALNVNGKKFSFTFAGNTGSMQNLETILYAFHQWSADRDDVELNIYGDGSSWNDLKSIVEQTQARNIHLRGRVPVTSIPDIYAASNVLLISLRKDAVMEKYVPAKFSTYLAAGKPIFAILSGAVSDYVKKFDLGLVAHPDDMAEIAKGFEYFTLLPNNKLVEIRQQATRLYKEEFDPELNLNRLTQIVFN